MKTIAKILMIAAFAITATFNAQAQKSCGKACKDKSMSSNHITSTNAVGAASVNATTETFKVWGNCGMCERTIEKAAKVEGVSVANWDKTTKLITVSFDTSKTSLDQIQKSIAASGYDNDKYRADDVAYNNLHGCCQYDRKQ
jgi:periplasmic mercuric ion binding protein